MIIVAKNILNGLVIEGTKDLLMYAEKEMKTNLLDKIPVVGSAASGTATALVDTIGKNMNT